jgi:hypothetical protein
MGVWWPQVRYGLIYLLNRYLFVPFYSGQGESLGEGGQNEFDTGPLQNEAGVLGFNCASALTQNAMYGVVGLITSSVQLGTYPSRPTALCLHTRSIPGTPQRNRGCHLLCGQPVTWNLGTYKSVFGSFHACPVLMRLNSRDVRRFNNERTTFCRCFSLHSNLNFDAISPNRSRFFSWLSSWAGRLTNDP